MDDNGIENFLNTLPESKREDILNQFLESISSFRQKAETFDEASSFKELRHVVHDVKTLARLISQTEFANWCESMEVMAINNDETARSSVPELVQHLKNTETMLEDYKNRNS